MTINGLLVAAFIYTHKRGFQPTQRT